MSSPEAAVAWDRVTFIEARVRQKGWSMAICAELAVELGLSTRTVGRYWEKAQRWTRRTLKPQDVETWRMHQLQLLDQSARAAKEEGRYGDVAQLLKVAASITGTNVAVKVEHGGTLSVNHTAIVAQVSAMTLEQLEEETARLLGRQDRLVIDVSPEPTRLRADAEPVEATVPMARAETPVNARQAAVERAMGRLRGG